MGSSSSVGPKKWPIEGYLNIAETKMYTTIFKHFYRDVLYSRKMLEIDEENFHEKEDIYSLLSQEAERKLVEDSEKESLFCPLLMEKKEKEEIQALCYGDIIVLQVEDKSKKKFELILGNSLDKDLIFTEKQKNRYVDCRKLFRVLPAISAKSQDALREKIKTFSGNRKEIFKDGLREMAEQARNEYNRSDTVYDTFFGKPVTFESKILLVHEATHQYLSLEKPFEEFRKMELIENYKPALTLHNSCNTHFQFLPEHPSQIKQGQKILINYSVKLVAECPNNKFDISSPFLYSYFDIEKKSEEEEKQKKEAKFLYFIKKDSNNFFRLKVIQKYDKDLNSSPISKPFRIQSTANNSCLQTHPDNKDLVKFSDDVNSWSGLWQKIEQKKSEDDDSGKMMCFKHIVTNKYLSFSNSEVAGKAITTLKLSSKIQYFSIKEIYSNSLFKILNEDLNCCLDLAFASNSQIDFSKKSMENITDIFRFNTISESEFIEIMLLKELKLIFDDFAKKFRDKYIQIKDSSSKDTQSKDMEELNDLGKRFLQRIIFLHQYLLNLSDNYFNTNFPMGSPISYRQDALFHYGILDTLIEILKNHCFKIENCHKIPISYAILMFFKSAFKNNVKIKKLMMNSLEYFLIPIYCYSETRIYLSLFKNSLIYDPQNPSEYSEMGKKFVSNIQETKMRIRQNSLTPENIRFFRKVISKKVYHDYSAVFTDQKAIESAKSGSLCSADTGFFSIKTDSRGQFTVSFSLNNQEVQDWELAFQEIKLLSAIMRKNREENILSFEGLCDKYQKKTLDQERKDNISEEKKDDYSFTFKDKIRVPLRKRGSRRSTLKEETKEDKGKSLPKDEDSQGNSDSYEEEKLKEKTQDDEEEEVLSKTYYYQLVMALQNENNDGKLRAGLLHLLCFHYIYCPTNKKNVLHKYYKINSSDEECFLKHNPSLSKEEIRTILEILISILNIKTISANTSLILIAEALRCGRVLLKLNLIWTLSEELSQAYLFALFSFMRILFALRKRYHKSADLRLDTFKTENPKLKIIPSLKNSFRSIIYKYNNLLKKSDFEYLPYPKQIKKLERLICKNFLFFQRARDYTLLYNAAMFFIEKNASLEAKKMDESLSNNEKSAIFPGDSLVKKFSFLIDDLGNCYNKYIAHEKEKKQESYSIGDEDFDFVDHLVLLSNRANVKKGRKELNSHYCLANLMKKRILFLRNMEFMFILDEEQEKSYKTIKEEGIKLHQLLKKKYTLGEREIESSLQQLKNNLMGFFIQFRRNEINNDTKNSLFLNAFRHLKLHFLILKFVKKNINLFVFSKKNIVIMYSFNEIFDLCCKILIYFCKSDRKHKNDLWPYMHFFLTSEIPIDQSNYDLELIYEICRKNKKIALTYTLNESIEKFKIKADSLFTSYILKESKSAKTTVCIFLEILKYDKLFPQAVWFFKLYKNIYGSLSFRPAQDLQDIEIFIDFISYLNTKIDSKVQEIGEEDPRKIFGSNRLFDLLVQFNRDIVTHTNIKKHELYSSLILENLLDIYIKLYCPDELSLKTLHNSDRESFYYLFAQTNPKVILAFYEKNNNVNLFLSKIGKHKNKLSELLEAYRSASIPENNCISLWTSLFNEIEGISEVNDKPISQPIESKISQNKDASSFGSDTNKIIMNNWIEFKKKNILIKDDNIILKEIKSNAKLFRTFIEEYFTNSNSVRCLGYIEYLKKSIKMFSNVSLLEREAAQQYNLRIFLLTLIHLLKIYEKNVLEKKISSTAHKRVNSLLKDIGTMKMCYKLLTQLPEAELPITEPLLFSLLKHLMYGEGKKNQKVLYKIFETNQGTSRIFKRIFQVMDFKIISITKYNIYSINFSSSFVSKSPYKLKLDLIKNIYGFLKIASDKQFSPFQHYFRTQGNIDQNYNIIKMSVLFLDKLIQNCKVLSKDTGDQERAEIKDKCLYIAQFPLRAILEFIQGPNEENLQEIINNGFLSIAEIIFSELPIESQAVDKKEGVMTNRQRNYAKMKLKYYVTKILKDILQYSINTKMIYSIFSKLLSKNTIFSFLSDYTYLFVVEHDMKYESELFFNYIKSDLEGSSFILEVGFEFVFLLEIFRKTSESTYSNLTEIQKIMKKHSKKDKNLFERIQNMLYKIVKSILCKEKFNSKVKNNFQEGRTTEETKKNLVEKVMGKVLLKNNAKVEVVIKNKPKILYFSRLPYIEYLEDAEKKELEEEVNFESKISRNEAIIRKAPPVLKSIKTLYEVDKIIQRVCILNLICLCYRPCQVLSVIFALIVNFFILAYDDAGTGKVTGGFFWSSNYNITIFVLGILLFCSTGLILLRFATKRLPYYFLKAKDPNWESFNEINEKKPTNTEIIGQWILLVLKDFDYMFYCSIFLSIILGLSLNIFCFSYTLTLLVIPLQIVRYLLRAIIEPMLQIFITLIIYLIVVYFFTIIASVNYKEYFPNGECSELLKCYLVTLDQTFKSDGGLSGYLSLTYENGPTIIYSRIIFDFFYAFVVGELFIQMISGIVIDKFGSMREETEKLQEQFDKECFICGKDRGILEVSTAKGFKYHISQEHCLWNYIFFLGYLKEKPQYELDSSESVILNLIKENQISWFPGKETPASS